MPIFRVHYQYEDETGTHHQCFNFVGKDKETVDRLTWMQGALPEGAEVTLIELADS